MNVQFLDGGIVMLSNQLLAVYKDGQWHFGDTSDWKFSHLEPTEANHAKWVASTDVTN